MPDPRPAQAAEREARQAAPDDWLETFARVGYAAKGVVYTVVGVLAVQAAFGSGGQTTGSKGALQEIASQSFGQILLGLTALGLACYGIWRLILATLDPKDKGTDAEGVVKRIGYAVSGLVNLGLAMWAARIVMQTGGGGGGSGSGSKQAMTAKLMSQPYGLWLVGIVGAIIVGVGLYHFYKAYRAKFMEKYKAGEMNRTERKWAKRIGQWGLSARGVTFAMIGVFFVQAALTANPSQAKGLGGAFRTLQQQSYGPWLLGLVAAGFVCYGVYCFSYARYRRFQTQTAV
ncbi:MAG: hypothetical protein BRD45_03215 [Bacteroidetes bacterium QS_8_64_10]|nr:MAG: hypothetical protein BRD45_03215 [Bacteroidetes bacterium QS_8_64_10]